MARTTLWPLLAIVLAFGIMASLVKESPYGKLDASDIIGTTNSSSSLSKRWVSVEDYETAMAGGLQGPWPRKSSKSLY